MVHLLLIYHRVDRWDLASRIKIKQTLVGSKLHHASEEWKLTSVSSGNARGENTLWTINDSGEPREMGETRMRINCKMILVSSFRRFNCLPLLTCRELSYQPQTRYSIVSLSHRRRSFVLCYPTRRRSLISHLLRHLRYVVSLSLNLRHGKVDNDFF